MWFFRLIAATLVAALVACGGGSLEKASVKAGTEQHVLAGAIVTLNGSAQNGTSATLKSVRWQLLERPAGSAAVLSNADKLDSATFTADVSGVYRLSLEGIFAPTGPGVDDYRSMAYVSVTATAAAPAAGVPPTAHAGPDQSVKTQTRVTLDGSASADANGDLLKPLWTFETIPQGSAAVLNAATSLHPDFVPDLPGIYVVALVVNDGKLNSDIAKVRITAVTANAAPVAHAGLVQNVTTGTQVALNGSQSSDADGDVLTFRWTLPQKPAGSAATLTAPTTLQPAFLADVAGTYVAELVVNDGLLDSQAASVTITAAGVNAAPVADAGPRQTVTTGALVSLDGSASTDVNADPLTYQWTFTSKVPNSNAMLSSSSIEMPTFVADMSGDYTVSLVVNDGNLSSAASTVTVTATDPINPTSCQINCPQ